ncbi:MAG TPA: TonB-dependent receptor [Sphingomicrobium sp.]|nr:TonB-dependent receptor [Sphingomicrobium sp.]
MFIADQPAAVAPSEQPGLIEVVATRRDQAQKIDRRTYRVRQGPEAAQADTLQLLRGLPAVIVTPDDQIMLLGSSNVTVLVDEKAVHGNAIQYLRTLRGSDIERIEIITNPSAQFSAQGTGGIVNIVLRRKQGDGLSGSASSEWTSLGRGEASATIKRKVGKWTWEVQAQGQAGTSSRSTYSKLRTVRIPGSEPVTNTEEGGGSSRSTSGFMSSKLSRELDSRTTLSAMVFGGAARSRSTNTALFDRVAGDFDPFSEDQDSGDTASFAGAELALDRRGPKEGQSLKATARLFGNPREVATTDAEFDDGGAYSIRREDKPLFADVKADWTYPIGKSRILSLGSSWGLARSERSYRFISIGDDSPLGPDAEDSFAFRQQVLAAYTTFQQRIGEWTVMPGVRVERFDQHISSPGHPSVDIDRTSLFPTFHLERPIGDRVTMTWSYSKRIDRPFADALRPYPIFSGGLAVSRGNPSLRDQSTDAYEVNLHYRHKNLDVGLILYNRETERLWSTRYFVDAQGLNVAMPVNAGQKTDRGAQFDVSTPLLPRLKAMASVNLFDSRIPVDPLLSDERERMFRYTGNATLEWRGRNRGDTPGDVAQVQFEYQSAAEAFQVRYDARYALNLSWTHSFTPKWAVTGQLTGIGSDEYRHRLFAPLVQEEYFKRERQPVFKLKLVRTIGSGN